MQKQLFSPRASPRSAGGEQHREMGDAELLEQLRAQVQSLRSPRSQHRAEAGSNGSGESGGRRPPVVASGIRSRASSRLASPMNDGDSPIVLNVGGFIYTTSGSTLKAVESSYFSLMLSGVWEPARTEEGHIFIDRNGKLFDYVLEYLRDQAHRYVGDSELPDDKQTLKALQREAEFYQLPTLAARIHKALQSGSRVDADMDALVLDDRERYDKAQYEKNQYDGRPKLLKECFAPENGTSIPQTAGSVAEFDVAYSSVSSFSPTFAEDKIQELVSRVNSLVACKRDDGFQIKNVNSGMLLDHAQQPPYIMYLQVVLAREQEPSQRLVHYREKHGPGMPVSSALVPSGSVRAPQQYPPPHPHSSEYQYSNSGWSTQDAIEHCSSEEGRYVSSGLIHNPGPNHRAGRPPQMAVHSHTCAPGALGSPIDHGEVDPNFSIVPQGYHERAAIQHIQSMMHSDGRSYDSAQDAYDPGAHRSFHKAKTFANGEESAVISPREPYHYGNGTQTAEAPRFGRESPSQRIISSNIPRLNLAVLGGGSDPDSVQMVYDNNTRPPSVQEISKRVEGWGNNHPKIGSGVRVPRRLSSPHPEFD